MEEAIKERTEQDNGYTPTSHYEILAERVQSIEQDNLKITLIHEIERTHTHIHTFENKLDARIDLVQEQIKSTNTHIESLETSTNTRMGSLETSINTRIESLETNINTRIDATNTRIDSLEASTNTRMDDMKTIIDKMDKRISFMLAISGIVFTGIFTILGVILAKLG